MSEQWQWASFIIGIVAFLIAIQPFTQAIWGKPKLVVGFEVENIADKQTLVCYIWNLRIRSRLLKMMYIDRSQIDDLSAEFEILSLKGMKRIGNTVRTKIKTQQGQMTERITLPASILPASFPIVIFNQELAGAYIIDNSKQQALLPSNGMYVVQLTVYFGHHKKQSLRRFVISGTPQYIYLNSEPFRNT